MTSVSDHTYKLTYFNIEGVAEKIRLAFVLAGINFEDDRINSENWAALKPTTKYGQLPILAIDGVEYSQSDAMLRMAGRCGDLIPTDPLEEMRMNEAIGISDDLDRALAPGLYYAIRPTAYGMPEGYNNTDEGKDHIRRCRVDFVTNKLPTFLDYFVAILKSTPGPFFGGESPNLADCAILPKLKKFRAGFMDHIPATCLDSHPEINAYIDSMLAVPAIAAWYARSKK